MVVVPRRLRRFVSLRRVATGVAVAAEALAKQRLVVGEVDDGAGEPG